MLGGLLGLLLAPQAAGAAGHHAPDPGAESAFVAAINDHRAGSGAPTLAVHGELVGVARAWAAAMADAGQISHNPNLAGSVRAPWVRLGENVGTGGSVESLMGAFAASSEHERIMSDAAFGHVGVGVVRDHDGRIFTAHVFMELASEPAATAGAPTAASQPAGGPRPAAGTSAGRVAPDAVPTPPSPPPPVALHDRLQHLSGLDRAAPLLPIALRDESASAPPHLTVHDSAPPASARHLAPDTSTLIGRSTAAPSPTTDTLFVVLVATGLVLVAAGVRHRPLLRTSTRNEPGEPGPLTAIAGYAATRPAVPDRSRIRWVPASRAALAQALGSPFEISPSGSAMERVAPYRARRVPVHVDAGAGRRAVAPIDLREERPEGARRREPHEERGSLTSKD